MNTLMVSLLDSRVALPTLDVSVGEKPVEWERDGEIHFLFRGAIFEGFLLTWPFFRQLRGDFFATLVLSPSDLEEKETDQGVSHAA